MTLEEQKENTKSNDDIPTIVSCSNTQGGTDRAVLLYYDGSVQSNGHRLSNSQTSKTGFNMTVVSEHSQRSKLIIKTMPLLSWINMKPSDNVGLSLGSLLK